MPQPLLRAYVHELPRLQAREVLLIARGTRLGQNPVSKKHANSMERQLRDIQKQAQSDHRPARQQADMGALMGMLRTVGMPVEKVPVNVG